VAWVVVGCLSVCVLLVAFLGPEDVDGLHHLRLSENAALYAFLEGVVVVCRDATFSLLGSTEIGLQAAHARLIISHFSTTIDGSC
jgi:hypothetical protein